MSHSKRAEAALEARTDAILNRLYWLQNQAAKRALTAEEQAELDAKARQYDAINPPALRSSVR